MFRKRKGGIVLLAFFAFFAFLIFTVLESFKFQKVRFQDIKRLREGTYEKKRIYNSRVCYAKLFFLLLSFLLFTINRFKSMLERSSGVRGFVILMLLYIVFFLVSLYDISRIRKQDISGR